MCMWVVNRGVFPSPAGIDLGIIPLKPRSRAFCFSKQEVIEAFHKTETARVASVLADGAESLTHGPCLFALTVAHHVCEQALEQAEFGGDRTGDPGKVFWGPVSLSAGFLIPGGRVGKAGAVWV